MTVEAPPLRTIRVQPGPQEAALASCADVTIFGGAAGGGKTFGILLSVVQYAHVPTFAAEIFRRTSPQLTQTGGIWLKSFDLFQPLGAEANRSELFWTFPSGARAKFSHMQHATDRYNYDGAQIPFVAFDQLESFEEEQFWYMVSRNRDPSGAVAPWMLCSCNPVPDDDPIGGWLHKLLQWWIDPGTGLAIDERSGAVRWVLRIDGLGLQWADSRDALLARFPGTDPKSITFIRSLLDDNAELLRADPGYPGRLKLLPLYERERLLGANWNARAEAGKVFNRAWFRIVEAVPRVARRVRYWDKAGTEGGGARSAGVLLAEAGGLYYVENVVLGQWSPKERNTVIRQTAAADAARYGYDVVIWIEQEPGSGGKESALISIADLAGYDVHVETVTGDKVTRAGPFAAQAEAGNVVLLSDEWNEPYLRELHGFPDGTYKDQVDGSSGAFNKLALGAGPMGFTAGGLQGEPEHRRVKVRG